MSLLRIETKSRFIVLVILNDYQGKTDYSGETPYIIKDA